MAAAARVLSTTELLEQVLLHLPMLELLSKQVVCQAWYSCVNDSPTLQRKLFLASIPRSEAPTRSQLLHYAVQPVAVNPLLLRVFHVRGHSEASSSSISNEPDEDHAATGSLDYRLGTDAALVCESLLEQDAFGSLDGWQKRPIKLNTPVCYRLEHAPGADPALGDLYDISVRRAADSKVYGDKGALQSYDVESWAPMFLTQPPIPTVSISCTHQGGSFGTIKVVAVDGLGVRLGELVKTAAELYGFCYRPGWLRRLVHTEIYQPIDDLRFCISDDEQLSGSNGPARLHHCKRIGFIRAWKTRLRCVLDE
ncbi:hypothetical protein LTR85_005273 [Meristemomyces frigidus]|nr:hypothetical protein LTR85_005273 [Meristemomyces frigidus]